MSNPTAQLPLARAVPVSSLPGVLRKTLDVPVQRQGIVYMRSGKHRLLSSGRHIVAVLLPRIIWNDTGDWAGFMPVDAFPAFCNLPSLLTGDEELVDASLLCLVKVANPLQFFQNVVMPRREIPASGLELPNQLLNTKLAPLVRRYAAEDLSAGLPTEFLLSEINDMVAHQVNAMGLELLGIQVFAVMQATDRVETAGRLAELESMLQDARLQNRFGDVQSQAELDGLMRELQQDSAIPAGVRPVFAPAAQPAPQASQKPAQPPKSGGLVAGLKSWLGFGPAQPKPAQATRLLELFQNEPAQVSASIALDHLTDGNRAAIDRLLRAQIDQEMAHIHEMLQDCRSRAYHAGQEDTALGFMHLLRDIESQRQHFRNPGFGKAAYGAGLNLTQGELGRFLAYDEGLLVQIASHSEFAHILQQNLIAGQPLDEDVKVLASRLQTFEHAFARRARVIPPR